MEKKTIRTFFALTLLALTLFSCTKDVSAKGSGNYSVFFFNQSNSMDSIYPKAEDWFVCFDGNQRILELPKGFRCAEDAISLYGINEKGLTFMFPLFVVSTISAPSDQPDNFYSFFPPSRNTCIFKDSILVSEGKFVFSYSLTGRNTQKAFELGKGYDILDIYPAGDDEWIVLYTNDITVTNRKYKNRRPHWYFEGGPLVKCGIVKEGKVNKICTIGCRMDIPFTAQIYSVYILPAADGSFWVHESWGVTFDHFHHIEKTAGDGFVFDKDTGFFEFNAGIAVNIVPWNGSLVTIRGDMVEIKNRLIHKYFLNDAPSSIVIAENGEVTHRTVFEIPPVKAKNRFLYIPCVYNIKNGNVLVVLLDRLVLLDADGSIRTVEIPFEDPTLDKPAVTDEEEYEVVWCDSPRAVSMSGRYVLFYDYILDFETGTLMDTGSFMRDIDWIY